MKIVFWIAYVLTIAEFMASSVSTLLNSEKHLQRLREIGFPIKIAKILAAIELIAVIVVIWLPIYRIAGGAVLAACFAPILVRGVWVKRPVVDILALGFFIACALVVSLY